MSLYLHAYTYVLYVYIFLRYFGVFSLISLRARTVRTNVKDIDRGRCRRGLGAIRAMCRAWLALKSHFFSAGVDKTISGVSFQGAILCPVFRNFGVFGLRISLKTARPATTLGSPCRDRLRVHFHASLGALRAMCRVYW